MKTSRFCLRAGLLTTALLLPLLPLSVHAASGDYTGALVGTVTGTVENDQGEMVEPRAAIEAIAEVFIQNGQVTAVASGTASCTEGLGLQITFTAQYDNASGGLTGFYSDVPNSTTLDKPITFTKQQGFAWTAEVSGQAPSATGLRAYDLELDIVLPDVALFPGTEFPPERSLSGALADSRALQIPVEIPALGVSQTVTLTVDLAAQWQAKAVPLGQGRQSITGNVFGTIATSEPATLVLNIPGVGEQSIEIAVTGRFGGSLITNSPTELAFIGSWSVSSGDSDYGGDLQILVPLDNIGALDALPYSLAGIFQITPEFSGALPISVPLEISGSFPFSL